MKVNPIPEGYHTVTPYLVVEDTNKLIEFLEAAFNATSTVCHRDEAGKAQHAELKIGTSKIMIGAAQSKDQLTKSMLYLYVEDVDAAYQQALAAGATSVMELTNQFYGDRSGSVQDFCGNQWCIASCVEYVSPEEIAKRAKEACKG